MTSTESARAGGRHSAPDDVEDSAVRYSAADVASYELRRRNDAPVTAPEKPMAPALGSPAGDAGPPDLGYTPALPISSFEDYVHPDYALQSQRQKSRRGRWIALLLVVLLAAGAGAYWYLQLR